MRCHVSARGHSVDALAMHRSHRFHSSTMVGKDGGKAKPLKAAKKAEKDYDEGACAALLTWPALFHDALACKRRACGALTRLLVVPARQTTLPSLPRRRRRPRRAPRAAAHAAAERCSALASRLACGGSRRLHARRTARTFDVRSAAEARALAV